MRKVFQLSPLLYPEPGSNRHRLPYWCLRPARLPIPPSGLIVFDCKGTSFFETNNSLCLFFSFLFQKNDPEVLYTPLHTSKIAYFIFTSSLTDFLAALLNRSTLAETITTSSRGRSSESVGCDWISLTILRPSTTCPKTVYAPSR